MSLFGSLMGDFDEDPFFGHHMRSMRQMNSMMNSLLGDPFGMFNGFESIAGPPAIMGGPVHNQRNALIPFGFPSMPNINRLLSGANNFLPEHPGAMSSYSSSSYVSMTSGPDGRPQIYQASSSTKTGPGGVCETQKTVQDSRTGIKKMAIGHHIGERAHVIEREQNVRTGSQEERQDFINLDEEEADDFDREFMQKSRPMMSITNGSSGPGPSGRRELLALPSTVSSPSTSTKQKPSSITGTNSTSSAATNTAGSRRRQRTNPANVPSRRPLRTPALSPLALPSSSNSYSPSATSIHPHPYNAVPRRVHRPMKGSHSQQSQHSPSGAN